MKAYRTYKVTPKLPEGLDQLRTIAYNLWWCWSPDAIELLRRIDRDLWEQCNHNPVAIFGLVSQDRWEELAGNEGFRQHLERVAEAFRDYLEAETWFERTYPRASGRKVAYFSLEYGMSEALPLYAGGLGVLAGDHLKSASDMGIPLCGVGLLYRVGYFRQYLNPDGWQQEEYTENEFHGLPVEQVRDDSGGQLRISIPTDGHQVHALVWRANVGRVPLYLLDTNTEQNSPDDRQTTYQLYGGDNEMRIRQEILLALGGMQALEALDIEPDVYHMNEGHAAFLGLERVRRLMTRENLTFGEAVEAARIGSTFTTHTPVPAGHDRFQPALMEKHFRHYYPQLGLTKEEFLALGRERKHDPQEEFCMTILALRLSAYRNGVSRLHGKVSRKMWQNLWPEVPEDELPIRHVTNGVHVPSFISNDMAILFDRYLGGEWRSEPGDETIWARVMNIPEAELWRTHERRRERLVAVVRRRHREQLEARGVGAADLDRAQEVLDPEVLTIGFGRRMATYKRATLLLRDPGRLKSLLTGRDRPIQVIFAGKAHPRDGAGKDLIRHIVHLCKDPEVRQRILFIENYDINLARYIVQGVDVWLNNPRRPLEASGTSGMKVSANGGLNCSILDGWWDEAYTPDVGWAIGRREEYTDPNTQDDVESKALYTILEQEIVPLFYDRGADGIPHGWVQKMKQAMAAICPRFNSNRMLSEYADRFYVPGMRRSRELAEAGYGRSKALAAWLQRVQEAWAQAKFVKITDDGKEVSQFGDQIKVQAFVDLGPLSPDDVGAELQLGNVDAEGEISAPVSARMEYVGRDASGACIFMGTIKCTGTGRWGYTVRLLPYHIDLLFPFDTGCILSAR